ncbi:DUF4232 domain-containing protein [Streptomyces sp. LZ34]
MNERPTDPDPVRPRSSTPGRVVALGCAAGLLGLLTACGTKPASETAAAPVPPPAPSVAPIDPSKRPYGDLSSPTPAAPPTCPESGVYVRAEEPSAAMGLRAMTLELVNCGKRTYTLRGYPTIRVLDEDGKALDIRVSHGSAGIATLDNFDAAPRQVTLRPKETAVAGLVWRNTVTDATTPAVNGSQVEITPAAGRPAQTVTALLDLGNTGKLGVSPWSTPEKTSTKTPTPRQSARTATR